MLDKMKQIYELQKKAKAVQKELKETEIDATAANGNITVTFNAEMRIVNLTIAEEELTADNKKRLESELIKAISEAISRAQAIAAEKSKDMMKDLNINLPGM